MFAMLAGYSKRCDHGNLMYARRNSGMCAATRAYALVKIAVHDGRLGHASRATIRSDKSIRRCTGTAGTPVAKCIRSTMIRRVLESGMARPRMRVLGVWSGDFVGAEHEGLLRVTESVFDPLEPRRDEFGGDLFGGQVVEAPGSRLALQPRAVLHHPQRPLQELEFPRRPHHVPE